MFVRFAWMPKCLGLEFGREGSRKNRACGSQVVCSDIPGETRPSLLQSCVLFGTGLRDVCHWGVLLGAGPVKGVWKSPQFS